LNFVQATEPEAFRSSLNISI